MNKEQAKAEYDALNAMIESGDVELTDEVVDQMSEFERIMNTPAPDTDIVIEEPVQVQGSVPVEDPEGPFRYRFRTSENATPVDVNFRDEVTPGALQTYMGEKGFKEVEDMQGQFANVADDKPVLSALFPRSAEAAAKGAEPGLFGFRDIARGTMDVASMPFRAGAALLDAGTDLRTPSLKDMYYTGGDNEVYTDKDGETVVDERGMFGKFTQEALRAPENIVGLAGGVMGLGPKALLISEAAGNVAGEGLRAADEERNIDPVNVAVGAAAPFAVAKAGKFAKKTAVDALTNRMKVAPSDQMKRFAPEAEVLFKEKLIPNWGGNERLHGSVNDALKALQDARVKLATELGDAARAPGTPGLSGTLEKAKSVEALTVDLMALRKKAIAALEKARDVGDLREAEKDAIVAAIDEEVTDLSGISVKGLSDYIASPPGSFLEGEPTKLPIDRALKRRTKWFGEGKIDNPQTTKDFTKAERERSALLWEEASPLIHEFDEISGMSTGMKNLVPLEKALEKGVAKDVNRSVLGGDIFTTMLKVGGNVMKSNPSLSTLYSTGGMLESGSGNLLAPLFAPGYRPYYSSGARVLTDPKEKQMFGPQEAP